MCLLRYNVAAGGSFRDLMDAILTLGVKVLVHEAMKVDAAGASNDLYIIPERQWLESRIFRLRRGPVFSTASFPIAATHLLFFIAAVNSLTSKLQSIHPEPGLQCRKSSLKAVSQRTSGQARRRRRCKLVFTTNFLLVACRYFSGCPTVGPTQRGLLGFPTTGQATNPRQVV